MSYHGGSSSSRDGGQGYGGGNSSGHVRRGGRDNRGRRGRRGGGGGGSEAPDVGTLTKKIWVEAAAGVRMIDGMKNLKVSESLSSSSQGHEPLLIPKRPGSGTVGLHGAVRANHFLVQLLSVNDFRHYDVILLSLSSSPFL
ncbi:protein argonaute 18-like [Chenopodium quinoa]|uniref:protein argonaute 18-like n=1 Tax=Chenopodium quinoa TaxID=63459 RepID=UPI000B77B557|nr:protein argonaute 18-like [Chenopodium quinoa]